MLKHLTDMKNYQKQIDKLLEESPVTLEEVEDWGQKLRKMGYSFRVPIANRPQKVIYKNGYRYHLITAQESIIINKMQLPAFMGHEGWALRKTSKI